MCERKRKTEIDSDREREKERERDTETDRKTVGERDISTTTATQPPDAKMYHLLPR